MVKSKLGRVEAEVVIRSINNRERKHRNLLRQYWPTIVFQLTNADNYAYQVFFFLFLAISIFNENLVKIFLLLFFFIENSNRLMCVCINRLISCNLNRYNIFIETVPLDYIYNDVRWILLYRCIPKEIFSTKFSKNLVIWKKIFGRISKISSVSSSNLETILERIRTSFMENRFDSLGNDFFLEYHKAKKKKS